MLKKQREKIRKQKTNQKNVIGFGYVNSLSSLLCQFTSFLTNWSMLSELLGFGDLIKFIVLGAL